jgi:hypothetical protein
MAIRPSFWDFERNEKMKMMMFWVYYERVKEKLVD